MVDAYVKVSSAWKRIKRPYVKVSSAWKGVNKAYVKVGSVWKMFYQFLTGNVVGGTFEDMDKLAPASASVGYRVTTGGAEQHNESGVYATFNTLVAAGHTMSEYDIRYSPTGDTSFLSGSGVNTWLPGGTQYTWTIQTSVPNVGRTVTGPVEIRPAGGGATIDSATVRLEVLVST